MDIPLARTELALIEQELPFARTEGHPNSMEILLARTEGALIEQELPFARTEHHPNSMEIPLGSHRGCLDRARITLLLAPRASWLARNIRYVSSCLMVRSLVT
uniref:hypothetical protein n=1 Tax=Prevotella sp. TaxID=59823 RepID=UPI0040288070